MTLTMRGELFILPLIMTEPKPSDYPMAQAVLDAYARGEEDEALEPIALLSADELPVGRILPSEPVIFYDIRGEREIELTQSFTDPDFEHFPTSGGTSEFVTMIQYDPSLDVRVAFPPEEHLSHTLSATVSQAGLRQLKVAESEKAVHLSYFFNGKSQDAEPGEERVTIPSPKGAGNYDETPELSAKGVCDALISGCLGGRHELIVGNFANVDVLGHIENEAAVIQAVQTVDTCMGEVFQTARKQQWWTIVTADHGTVESWLYPEGAINTGHTSSPVPCMVIPPAGNETLFILREGGGLADVAPTVLELLGIEKPEAMTGSSLIQWQGIASKNKDKPRVLLLILDGWGYSEEKHGNLIAQAKTPNFDALWSRFPKTTISAAGEAVGMPPRAVGNSESGHLHLGSGRIIYSDRVRIDRALKSGEFFKNESFLWAMQRAKELNKPLHLLGIVSFYSSHGSLEHLFALMEMAKSNDVQEVFIHSLLGRRGERPASGARYIAKVEAKCEQLGLGQVVSVMGRFWALDREHYWDRVEKAYRCLAFGDGHCAAQEKGSHSKTE